MARERLYFADNLRILVVLSLIPFHAALTYTGHGDVYAYDPGIVAHYLDRSLPPGNVSIPMDLFVDLLDNFFMRLLFFVSGIVAWFSLENRTPGKFLGERTKKLLLPLISGIILIIPIMSYIRNVCLFDFKGSFFEFYPHFFNGPRGGVPGGNFEWGHLWFLIYLFTFSLITLPLFKFFKREKISKILKNLDGCKYVFLPVILLAIFECLLRPGWPGTLNLYSDWANFINYLLFYIFGFLLSASPNLMDRLKRLNPYLTGAGFLFFAVKIILWKSIPINFGYNWPTYYVTVSKAIAGYFLVLGITGLAGRYMEWHSSRWRYLSESSFGIYVFHFLPVTLVAYYLNSVQINFYLKFAIVVLASYPLVFLIYEIARIVPPVRYLFSLRRK
jgi:surface polysaccharide O-acyltransferase-like enzyme